MVIGISYFLSSLADVDEEEGCSKSAMKFICLCVRFLSIVVYAKVKIEIE